MTGLGSAISDNQSPEALLPVISLLLGALLWGLTWWPLKFFSEAGLTGNLIGMTAYALVGLFAVPMIWRQRHAWLAERGLFFLIGFFFATANICFTTALMQGEVVRVMLLFYLLPAWGALGGVLFLGEKLSKRRCIAIVLSLTGVFVIMGGLSAFNQPFSTADLMALVAGFCLSATGVVNKKAVDIPMMSRSLIPFVFCPVIALVANYFSPMPTPVVTASVALWLVVFAFVWLLCATLFTTYGVMHIEVIRASVLQVTELFVAIISAILIGGEVLEIKEYIGGALIIVATLLEALPMQGAA